MPVDEKANSLRSALNRKSTEELEELLALDFSEQDGSEPDVEYMMTIMEVIHEREGITAEKQAEVDAAWKDFQDHLHQREPAISETGTTEKPSLDHSSRTNHGQAPRKRPHFLRYCAAVAAIIVLFAGTASALHWNIFQALADWTEETFSFLTGTEPEDTPAQDVFRYMQLEVDAWTDTPTVPKWAPEGTTQVGGISVAERSNRVRIQGAFLTGEHELTVSVTIYGALPEEYQGTYQKDDTTVQKYETNGVVHYIMQNNEYCGATWANGTVEGSIQGNIELEDIKRMIDSIYEE